MSEPIVPDMVLPTGVQKEGAKEAVLNKACDNCRALKVRCFPDPGSSSGICQRCAKSKRTCTFVAPQKRKQRVRTDTRVAELEKQMRAMRSLLKLGSDGGNRATEDINDASLDHNPSSRENNNHKANMTPSPSNSMNMLPPQLSDRTGLDSVDRGLLSMAAATELFNVYVNELAPHYPAVTFPEHYTAEELRRQRPLLFSAVMAAASGKTDPILYDLLNTEILQVYASQTVISGKKSIELVQSMLVTALWYYPKDTFDQLRFYQYIHIAATIALDIGLGSKPNTSSDGQLSRNSTKVSPVSGTRTSQDELQTEEEINIATVDARRTILVCYLTCSNVAISVRRSNMLRINSWMKECVNFLENYSMATVFDKRLIARIRLQNIAEEFASSLGLEDPDDTSIVLDSRTLLTVKAFERRLKVWRESQEPEIMNAGMLMEYYQLNILLHEIALRDDHSAADFKLPHSVNKFSPGLRVKEKLTAPAIDAVMQCVISSHDLLDTFLRLDVDTLRAMPIYKFAMVLYAIVILTKLSQSVNNPASEIGKILDHNGLALVSYYDAVVAQFTKAAGPEGFRVPSQILRAVLQMRYFSQQQDDGTDTGDKVTRPLLDLSLQESFTSATHPACVGTSEIDSTMHESKSTGAIPSDKRLPSDFETSTAYSHASSSTPNINSTRDDTECAPQDPPEPVYAYHGLRYMDESDMNHEPDMEHLGLSETDLFAQALGDWMPSTSVTGQNIDEQMFDFGHFAYNSHSQD